MPPHILDTDFVGKDVGLKTPVRHQTGATEAAPVSRNSTSSTHNTLTPGGLRLAISNLDHANPTGYTENSVPRMVDSEFNKNIFELSSIPQMPVLLVHCTVTGFNPKQHPIHWRLQCLHVLGRYCSGGHSTYHSSVLRLAYEWQGYALAPQFTLFASGASPTPVRHETAGLVYTYRPPLMHVASTNSQPDNAIESRERVIGGHAILTVTARPPGTKQPLMDYVHLRIHGTNPSQQEREASLTQLLSGRNDNILNAVKAILIQESGSQQFLRKHQIGTRYEGTHFGWPADPEHFPNASFDYGVGLTQETHFLNDGQPIQYWTRTAWDWQENLRTGTDEFFGKMRSHHRTGDTWHSWMMRSWRAYNGSGPRADAYAVSVSRNEFGRLITDTALPRDWRTQAAPLPKTEDASAPPPWPPADMNAVPNVPSTPDISPLPQDQAPHSPEVQPTPQEPMPTATPPQDQDTQSQNYTIKPGDTLSGIASQFKVSVTALAQANNISNPNLIRVGQTLTIP